MADYSIWEEVHPEGCFDEPLNLVDYLYHLKASNEDGWTNSKTLESIAAASAELQTHTDASSNARLPSGTSTTGQDQDASFGSQTQRPPTRGDLQAAPSACPTDLHPFQPPSSKISPPAHLRQRPTPLQYHKHTSERLSPYQPSYSNSRRGTYNTSQGVGPRDCSSRNFQRDSGSDFAETGQRMQTTEGSEGISELDKATEVWRRRFCATQRLKDGSSDARGDGF